MSDLQRDIGKPDAAGPLGAPDPNMPLVWRVVRSSAFLLAYACYLAVFVGLGQRLVLWPMIALFPQKRRTLVGRWLRFNARVTLAVARIFAAVRVHVQGAIGPESCIIVMNHQSVLDIPIGLSLVHGPYPLIPTRDRYRRGIPGVSPLTRLARYPFVSQGRSLTRGELRGLMDAADQVAQGTQSLLIFPEGHRSRDGSIGPFMSSGLRLILRRARRPVYCVVADGITQSRTFANALTSIAGTRVRAVITGPFDPPETVDIDAFIESMHARMADTLVAIRATPEGCEVAIASRPGEEHHDQGQQPAPSMSATDPIGAR